VVLAIGTVAALAVAVLLVHNDMSRMAAIIVPALVAITLGISLRKPR